MFQVLQWGIRTRGAFLPRHLGVQFLFLRPRGLKAASCIHSLAHRSPLFEIVYYFNKHFYKLKFKTDQRAEIYQWRHLLRPFLRGLTHRSFWFQILATTVPIPRSLSPRLVNTGKRLGQLLVSQVKLLTTSAAVCRVAMNNSLVCLDRSPQS